MNITLATDEQLLEELKRRMTYQVPSYPCPPQVPQIFEPYKVLELMVKAGWKEDERTGFSDPRITKMWEYVGFPTLTDDDSYCAATVNACLKLCGYPMSEKVPSALSFANYGQRVINRHAVKGDIVVLKKKDSSWQGHVGFYMGESSSSTLILGGNQGNRMSTLPFDLTKAGRYELVSIRNINELPRGLTDYKTLKEWGLL